MVSNNHYSVLLRESVDALDVKDRGIYIDATFGRGGHSREILKRVSKDAKLIAFDKDLDAIDYAKSEFSNNDNFTIVHSSFTKIYDYCHENGLLGKIDGIIADLGISSPQIDNPHRGFSFNKQGPLDMRMDTTTGMTAANVLTNYSKEDLAYIFKTYGEERFAKKIASAIKEHLVENTIETTNELSELIRKTIGQREAKNPATRCFQALRIYVNNELGDVEDLLEDKLLDVMSPHARLAVISFHSLEDRIVKTKLTNWVNPPRKLDRISRMLPVDDSLSKAKWVIKKQKPNTKEISQNVRSRSAMLRVVEKG